MLIRDSCGGSGVVRKFTNTLLGQMQTQSTCPYCNGAGETITKKCGTCNGLGTSYGEETLNLEIPAGLQEGMQMAVTGKGNSGEPVSYTHLDVYKKQPVHHQ